MKYRLNLSMITFDLLSEQYQKSYGKKFANGVSMPNPDDSMRVIHNDNALVNYKEQITKQYGDVMIDLHSEESIWFDRIKIIDEKFLEDKDKFNLSKLKAMDRWSKEGFNTD